MTYLACKTIKISRFGMEKIKRYNCLAIHLLFSLMLIQQSASAQNGNGEKPVLKTIVIDAGHGGKDPGCHGAAANEKSVCLSIALKLGALIKSKYPDIKVVYTRDKDVFVELNERANIANRAKADLFICIHANSASPAAYGAETYVLGLHRTESQKHVAERENSTIYLEDDNGAKYKDFDMSPDALIARQLQLAVFLDQSINFADKLQKEFKKLGRYDRGVKQAGFLVLYKTTMPSVLIETGFLTNPSEEKFLGDTTGQRKMANSMFTAFENYKNELEGVVVKTSEIEANIPQASSQPANRDLERSEDIVFRVQIETSEKKIATTAEKFMGLDVFEYMQDNLFKYTVGMFTNDFKAASTYGNELREQGFQHAFVVAFQNGQRINLEKAIKLAEK
jgi:N-acetylmuramoyl-L-alanine amidase